jgi:hypothetical protein
VEGMEGIPTARKGLVQKRRKGLGEEVTTRGTSCCFMTLWQGLAHFLLELAWSPGRESFRLNRAGQETGRERWDRGRDSKVCRNLCCLRSDLFSYVYTSHVYARR